MRKLIAFGLVVVSLGGCDQLPFLGGPASPHRKPGLWEQTTQSDRSPTPLVSEACYDEASDRRMPVLPRKPQPGGRRQCEKFQISQNGDSYVIDSVCSVGGPGGPKLTNHAVLTGDFNVRYTVANNIVVENSPDPARNGAHRNTVTAVYKGACPPDIGPGQVKLPTGEVVDMAQLRNRFGGGRGGGLGGGGPSGGNAPATNAPAGAAASANSASDR